jgi:hypothetical protein
MHIAVCAPCRSGRPAGQSRQIQGADICSAQESVIIAFDRRETIRSQAVNLQLELRLLSDDASQVHDSGTGIEPSADMP